MMTALSVVHQAFCNAAISWRKNRDRRPHFDARTPCRTSAGVLTIGLLWRLLWQLLWQLLLQLQSGEGPS